MARKVTITSCFLLRAVKNDSKGIKNDLINRHPYEDWLKRIKKLNIKNKFLEKKD